MKALLIIPSVLVSLVSFPSWGLTMDDLVKRAGRYYEKFTAVPFTGEIEGMWKGSFRKGKREGSWESYYHRGQLLSKGDYENGREDGVWEYYHDNGQLHSKGAFKSGKKDGSWVGYNQDGIVNIDRTGTYRNSVKVSE